MVCALYTHAQTIFLLCCRFLIIILKTVGVAETRTLLCHEYKATFQSKSRVCNSSNKKLIRVPWPLCTCPAYILTLLQDSNHYLENCSSSCRETNPTMPYVQAIFQSKSSPCNSSKFCDLYAHAHLYCYFAGPSCSKLTMSLVNHSLKI